MGTCKSVATTSAEPVVGVARGEEGGACAARRYRKVSPLDDSHRFDLQSPLFGSHDRSGGILGTSSSLASGQSHPLATTSSRGTASRVSASVRGLLLFLFLLWVTSCAWVVVWWSRGGVVGVLRRIFWVNLFQYPCMSGEWSAITPTLES